MTILGILIIGVILFWLYAVMFKEESKTLAPAAKKTSQWMAIGALCIATFEGIRFLTTGK